ALEPEDTHSSPRARAVAGAQQAVRTCTAADTFTRPFGEELMIDPSVTRSSDESVTDLSLADEVAEGAPLPRRGWLRGAGVALIGALSAVVAGRGTSTAFADVIQTTSTTSAGANFGLSAAPAATAPAAPVSGTYGVVGRADATAAANLSSAPPGPPGGLGGATTGTSVVGS